MNKSQHKHDDHAAHKMNDDMQSHTMDHSMHEEHKGHDMSEHSMHNMEMDHSSHGPEKSHTVYDEHAGHGKDHSGHEQMFRSRFWSSPICCATSMSRSACASNDTAEAPYICVAMV